MERTIQTLTSNEVIQWRDLLKKRKAAFLNAEKDLKNHAFDLLNEQTGEISKIRLHTADLATNTQEIETLGSMSLRNIKSIQEIEAAMARLEKGAFGYCSKCQEPISIERLKVIPEARYCRDCEQDIEEQGKL